MADHSLEAEQKISTLVGCTRKHVEKVFLGAV